jgi:protein-tyrosine phosphatase
MARLLVHEGAAHATALAHQNPDYPQNTADRLRAAAAEFAAELAAHGVPLAAYPTGEVMLTPDTLGDWKSGKLLSVGDHHRLLLVEMPHDVFLNVLPIAAAFRDEGIRLVIAHAERYPQLLDDPGLTAEWIAAGCLIQVTARAFAEPADLWAEKRLKQWAAGGFVHLLGSDGHGLDRRRPVLAAGFERLAKWAGRAAAERIGAVWGAAALRGVAVHVPPPRPPSRSWFSRIFGG